MLSRTTVSFSSSVLQEEDKGNASSSISDGTFQQLGGTIKRRETGRHETTHVPAPVRNRDRLIRFGGPAQPRYERVAFERDPVTLSSTRQPPSCARAIPCSTPSST